MYTFKAKVGDLVIVLPINDVGEVVSRRFSSRTGADIYTIKFDDPVGDSPDTYLSFLGDEIETHIPEPAPKVDKYILTINYKPGVPKVSQDVYKSGDLDKMMRKVSAMVVDVLNGKLRDVQDIRITPMVK